MGSLETVVEDQDGRISATIDDLLRLEATS